MANVLEGQEGNTPEIWGRVWDATDDREFLWWVNRESHGVRAGKIFAYIREHLGDPAALRTIEVGSGAGVYSLLLARQNASVTLLDYSPQALALAEAYFSKAGLRDRCNPVLGDALRLSDDLKGRFDVALSFGTVEHFRYPERLQIAQAHVDLVKPGGVVVISVPNRMFLPHETLKLLLQRTGKWGLGYEGAFTRGELRNVATRLGLRDVKIVGSALRTDLGRYLHMVSNTRALRHVLPQRLQTDLPTEDRSSRLDDLFGADLVLLGRR